MVTAQILRQLGGEYATFAEEMERSHRLSFLLNSRLKTHRPTAQFDVVKFFNACDPSRRFSYSDPEDRQYYIDFSSVRGSNHIRELKRAIYYRTLANEPTCQLFAGHAGCGKSVELLRLKAELEELNFYVIYFESSEDLDLSDVDVTDILLAVAHQVSEKLKADRIYVKSSYLINLFAEIGDTLQIPMEISQAEFSVGVGKITARIKASPKLRNQLRQFMEPRTNNILKSINEELLGRATAELKRQGKQGLVVLIDDLDRVNPRQLQTGRTLSEYLFIDRGDQLSKLNCHVVYTIPLALVFSNENETLKQRFGGGIAPKVLPMVPVQQRNGNHYGPGIHLLRHMILARAFPEVEPIKRLDRILDAFESRDALDHLCIVSGGHLPNLLGLVQDCIYRSDPPFSRSTIEQVIQKRGKTLVKTIDDNEWSLIIQLVDHQHAGEVDYQTLLRISKFVFEYQDAEGSWFSLDPLLEEGKK